jgi:hypothetical protein
MRRILGKVLQILDGTPAEHENRGAGQSLVELALVTPILIILLSGMVEIGWFANNYLTLLDTARAGARRGATLQNENAPQAWDNLASYLPVEVLPPAWAAQRIGYFPYSSADPDDPRRKQEQFARSVYHPFPYPPAPYDSGGGCAIQAFFNNVICTMVSSLEPLSLNPENGVDDIIVSAFSLEAVDPTTYPDALGSNRPVSGNVPQVVVVGRYPTNANECDAVETAPGTEIYSGSMDLRDPFDFNENLRTDRYAQFHDPALDVYPLLWNPHFSELAGYDADQDNIDISEKQVGFSWFGQHRITIEQPGGSHLQTLCLGSQFSIADVEDMVNLETYVPVASTAERRNLPGMGLVLVEIHWEHEMLLKLPVFNPVFDAMSPDGKPPKIYVWAVFPLPAADPTIIFQ